MKQPAKWKELMVKYREPILYILFGGLTTLVNIAAYALCTRLFGWEVTPATVLAWLVSVLFAYATNRKWVFQSRAAGARAVSWEIATFFGGRAFSGLLDLGVMYLFAERLGLNDLVIKIISNILVILMNYVISKWIVFRKRK